MDRRGGMVEEGRDGIQIEMEEANEIGGLEEEEQVKSKGKGE